MLGLVGCELISTVKRLAKCPTMFPLTRKFTRHSMEN
jgi:hypothetical protein